MQKFGRIADIDAVDTNEEIWDGQSAYSWPAAAATMTLSCVNGADVVDGTGARTVRIYGLDASYDEVSFDLSPTLAGTEIPTDLIRVYRAYVLTAGTGGTNAGDIWIGTGTITSGVPANKYAGILAGNGQTLMAIYTMPVTLADGTVIGPGTLTRWYASIGAVSAAFATIALMVREFGGAWRVRRVVGVSEGGLFSESPTGGIEIPPKADVMIRVLTNGVNGSDISGGFDIQLSTWDENL